MLGFTTVAIEGPSMEPTLQSGEWWFVRRTSLVRPGEIIVFWHPYRADFLAVKRVDHLRPEGWWVLGDNPDASEDSRSLGAIDPSTVLGRLMLRYRSSARRARS